MDFQKFTGRNLKITGGSKNYGWEFQKFPSCFPVSVRTFAGCKRPANHLQSNDKQTTTTTAKGICNFLFLAYCDMKTKRQKQEKENKFIFAYIYRYRKKSKKISKKICTVIFFYIPLQKKQQNKICTMLNNSIKIYVPSTYEGNKPAKRMQKKAVKHTAKYFCKFFGGATATTAEGFWQSDKLGLIKEKQIIVYSNCTDADKAKHLQNVLTIAKGICKYMKQEAVTVEINGTLQFIEA